MRALVLKAFKREGTTKATGKPYESFFIAIALPFTDIDFGSYKETGFGVNYAEIPLEPSLLPKFAFMNGKPAYMDLATTEKIIFGELKTVVVDAKVASSETKAA
ncbi:MAG: hypothetical protein DU481_15205 [Nitrosomonas sp.]|uniref:hypothetical protein n=1 Tax=Nitrosomonas sp. TaxID=42353 RepID=UPI0032ECB6B9